MIAALVPAVDALSAGLAPTLPALPRLQGAGGGAFADMLSEGLSSVSAKVNAADGMMRAFAVDDSIPVHQVTFALAEARLSLELMLQVRGRLVEAYQQLMNMQL